MTPQDFIAKWRAADLKERSASQSHFNDLCALLGVLDPITADPTGEWFAFEKGASKTGGGEGWADVWRRGCFAWEYKGPKKDLDKAFAQLLQYSVALENPPLLIVSDMDRIRIHTNWTNTVQEVHEFTLEDLLDGQVRERLKRAFTDPEDFRPRKTRQALTEETAREFAAIAQRLRDRGHEAHQVAHFVNQLVFCMFAEDVGLLPDNLFSKMLDLCRSDPASFAEHCGTLFGAMAQPNGKVGFQRIDWFNGGLFQDDFALPVTREDVEDLYRAAQRDWSQIDPSILGTLFDRGLDPAKRSQLGAHSPAWGRNACWGSNLTPMPPNWRGFRCGSAKSSGCAATALTLPRRRGTKFREREGNGPRPYPSLLPFPLPRPHKPFSYSPRPGVQ